MSPNILLINPWIHDFTAFDLWVKPLGLLYVGSTLRHFGYGVDMVDCLHGYGYPQKQRHYGTRSFYSQPIDKPSLFKDIPRTFKRYGMPLDEFRRRLADMSTPLMVCMTSHMTYWYPGVFDAIKIVKTIFPSVPVVLGGIYATLCYEHARNNSGADYVIKGYGELEVLKLADALSAKKRDYGNFEEWAKDAMVPAYELYPELSSVSVITSRGCPYRCSYCASFLFEPKLTFRDVKSVVTEIEKYVNERHVEDVAFYDDALLVDSERHIIPILERLIRQGIRSRYHTPNGLHPKYIDHRLAGLFRKAGFRTIRLGFEGTSAVVQRASRHKVSCRELENALYCLREAEGDSVAYDEDGGSSWDIGVYVIIGMPGQTVAEIIDAVEYVNELGVKIKLAEYSPVPGTEEFQKLSQRYPQVNSEPLSHNKCAFATVGMGIEYDVFDNVKALAKRLNAGLRGSGVRHWS